MSQNDTLFLYMGIKNLIGTLALVTCSAIQAKEPVAITFDTTSASFKAITANIWASNSQQWDCPNLGQAYYDYTLYDAARKKGSDATLELRGFDIDATDLFSSFKGGIDNATPQNGVFGPLNKRLQIYISKYIKKDKNSFVVYGADKREKQIHQFTGVITVEKVVQTAVQTSNTKGDTTEFTLIARYQLKEDKDDEGSGIFEGTYCAKVKAQMRYDFLSNTLKREIWTNDDKEGSYNYTNRNFVGEWTGYVTKEKLKAIWGDNTLPFPQDFKIGIGEGLNEKYMDMDWESYLDTDSETEAVYNDEGEKTGYKQKDEWWGK